MSKATPGDEESGRVLRAIRRKIRPYNEGDIAMAAHLSRAVVRRRCRLLEEAGLIRRNRDGPWGPYWELADQHRH